MKQKTAVAEIPSKPAVPAHTKFNVSVYSEGTGDDSLISAKVASLVATELDTDDLALTNGKPYKISLTLNVELDT